MIQRDLYYLNELGGKFNLTQIKDRATAQTTNGYCYLEISDDNNKQFNEGFFKFTGKGTLDEVILPKGYEIRTTDGEIIATYLNNEPFKTLIGEQGEFYATFDREELLFYLKYYLSTWRIADSDKYKLVFHRDDDCWRLRGYNRNKIKVKELPILDTNVDTTFKFAVNPHTFRHILKWFECDFVKLYFHNGNYTCRTAIFMHANNKLAVLMPIARKK